MNKPEDVKRRPFKMTPDGKKLRVTTEKLTHLPESIGTLDGLEILNLSDCSQLSELPDAISGLKALTQLNLEGCSSLAALPTAIGELGALRLLYLRGCSSLVALPDAIGELKALTHLSLKGCSSLAALPVAIGELKALTKLYLGGCASLAALPATIGELGALTELDLTGCSSLTTLPDAIRAMPGLTICDSNSGLDKASDLMRKWDVADRGQPEEEHEAGIRKILEESEDTLSDAQMLTLRRLQRRVCDACGRQGTLEVERFPVCWCGARRYCDEKCQQVDWDRGHSATCASGHTFPQNLLNDLRVFYVDAESNKIFQKVAYEQYPPPADRVR